MKIKLFIAKSAVFLNLWFLLPALGDTNAPPAAAAPVPAAPAAPAPASIQSLQDRLNAAKSTLDTAKAVASQSELTALTQNYQLAASNVIAANLAFSVATNAAAATNEIPGAAKADIDNTKTNVIKAMAAIPVAVSNAQAAFDELAAAQSTTINGFPANSALDTNGFAATFSKWIDIEAGMIVLSPFSITRTSVNPNKYELAPSSTDVRGMVQVIYQNRYAWRAEGFDPNLAIDPRKDGSQFQFHFDPTTVDFEFRGGYAYGGSGSQSGATSGAGDFFEEASFGWNLLKLSLADKPNDKPLVSSINLEGFEGMFSDRDYSIIHPTFGGGVAYVAGFPLNTSNSTPKIELLARSGIAWVDSPYLGGTAADGNAIVDANNNGDPKFILKPAWANTAELRLPIDKSNQYGNLVFGGSVYFLPGGEQRDQWSMYAGYSIAPASLLNLIEAPLKLFFPNL